MLNGYGRHSDATRTVGDHSVLERLSGPMRPVSIKVCRDGQAVQWPPGLRAKFYLLGGLTHRAKGLRQGMLPELGAQKPERLASSRPSQQNF
jgi:hypothetical protein